MNARRVLGNALRSVAERLNNLAFHLCHTHRQTLIHQWHSKDGDKTLRLDYDLTDDSIVFDLGGYRGDWSSDIFSRYCCQIEVFEPVARFAQKIEERFSRNGKVRIHRFGLSDRSGYLSIGVANDGSSVYKLNGSLESIRVVSAFDFVQEQGIRRIDLMKINIEGGEYDLLDHLIECGLVKSIENIQIQFHDFVPNAEFRMEAIQRRLSETHTKTYEYRFVWENWKKKTWRCTI